VLPPDRGRRPPDSGSSKNPAATSAHSHSGLDPVLAGAADAIVVVDRRGRISAWNPAAERLFGIAAGDAIGQSLDELTNAPGIAPGAGERSAWHGRTRVRPSTGSRRGEAIVLEASAAPVEGDRGQVLVLRDVTAAARLEEELTGLSMLGAVTGGSRPRAVIAQDAVERLSRATDAAMAIILTATEQGYVIEAGQGLTPEFSELGLAMADSPLLRALRPVGAVVSSDLDRAPLRAPVRDALRELGVERLRLVGLRVHDELSGLIGLGWGPGSQADLPDGLLLQAAAHVANALENARLVDVLAAEYEEERQLRSRLVVSEERYRTLFEESPEPLLLIGRGRQILDANAAATAQFRTTREDLLGRRADELSTGPIGDSLSRREVERRQGRTRFHSRGLRPDGTSFPAEITITRVDIAGEPRSIVLIRDLTTVERLQAELLQAQKMEAMGQLVSGVAHELNNPLAAVIGYSQLISSSKRLPEDMRHEAQLLAQEADRTRRIVQNLLDFARQRPPERHPTGIRALVESVLGLQSYAIAAGQIDVRVTMPSDLPPVEVDRAQMQQVLLNLTLNAIQAIQGTGAPGRIDIVARAIPGDDTRTDDGRDRVRLEVRDTGPGVPRSLRSRLFVPFFTTKEPGTGTGLGLSVSFGIVAAHQGRLWFEEPDGGGSSFVLEIPVTAASPAEERAVGPAGAGQPMDGRTRVEALRHPVRSRDDGHVRPAETRRPRVLVLDDEPAIRAILEKALDVAGMDPVVVADGQEAIERVRRERFDLVMCDHRMAGMYGTEVHEAIAAIRPELARRFVFMSGDVLNPELRAFAADHHVGLLAKPFDIETVTRTVRQLLAEVEVGEVASEPLP
jgi:PAS domain S-box-containing protein